jgi:hypothetical protein
VVQELVDIERLDQVVRCPLFEGGHGLAHVREGRHQDEVREWRVAARVAQQGQPVDAGQTHVAQDDVERRLLQKRRRLDSIARLGDDVPGIRQDLSQFLPDVRLIIYDEDIHAANRGARPDRHKP